MSDKCPSLLSGLFIYLWQRLLNQLPAIMIEIFPVIALCHVSKLQFASGLTIPNTWYKKKHGTET